MYENGLMIKLYKIMHIKKFKFCHSRMITHDETANTIKVIHNLESYQIPGRYHFIKAMCTIVLLP